jgi:thiosulfate dehydrogenase
MKRLIVIVVAITACAYVGAIAFGLRIKSLSFYGAAVESTRRLAWEPPPSGSIPKGLEGDSIWRGSLLFNETNVYAAEYARAHISCGSCHAAGGIQPYSSPMVGLPALFPMFNKRAGHIISLQDRIEECFVRSENGKPVPYESPEMQALVNYINWLSRPEPARLPFVGRGLVHLPELEPDEKRGALVYSEQCTGCHGPNGEGLPPQFPPLWGPDSFNDGAGMNDINKMAPFVQHNMPQNRMGILSAQEAFDVSAYIHSKPRPQFNTAYRNF